MEIPREYAPDDVGRGARLVRALPLRELGIAAFIVLTFIVASIVQPRFVSIDNIRSILLYTPLIVVVAMGQMMVIITRNIDLSVGSMMGLAGIIACGIFRQHPQFPVAVATMLAIAVGAALGLINGLLVAQLRVPAIIATLGTMTTYRGLVFIVSHGQQINSNDLPDTLLNLRQTGPLGISWLVVIACIIAIATALFLRYARAGREIYAIGSNPGAAVLRGIGVRSRLMLVFVATGALSGLAGMMYAAKFWQVNPRDAGRAFELVAISAVVLGGVNVFGGSGTVLGVLLGCLMLGVINVALSVMRIPEGFQVAAYGAAILIAATIDTLLQRRLAPSPFGRGLG